MMPNLTEETRLLDTVSELIATSVRRFRCFVDDPILRSLGSRFAANLEKRDVDLGFNAFALVSDIYYRENLHSDMMAAILDPKGAHSQGDRFLMLFLGFLRDHHRVEINLEDYRDAIVEREPGRIDILIRGTRGERPKAIIIENKINGAVDMDRQVVRYLEQVEDTWRHQCDAIIFLTLHHKGEPGMLDWTEGERLRVTPLLTPLCAFEDGDDDLYSGWLAPCEKVPTESSGEVAHVIRQYRQLILKLGRNAMNQPLMEEFYELLKDEERYKAAVNLNAIMNDLPAFRCLRLMERFRGRSQPFGKPWIYGTTDLVLEGLPIEGGSRIKIDVETGSQTETVVSFWDNVDPSSRLPKEILGNINLLDEFPDTSNGRLAKTFAFPTEENALREFLEKILRALSDYVKTTSTVK